MLKRIGMCALLMFMLSCVMALCETDASAAGFRRRRMMTPVHYNTKAAAVQPETTSGPKVSEKSEEKKSENAESVKEENAKPEKSNEKTYSAAKPALPGDAIKAAAPKSGFSEYELFAMDFSEVISALPENERETLESILEEYKPDYRSKIDEKYPEVRTEVKDSLAKIAEAVHLNKSRKEIGAIVKEMPLKTRELSATEVLAINQELAPAIDPEEFRAVHELNQFRMRSGLRPCVIDLLLCLVSRGHSSDMRNYGFFSHNSPIAGKGNFSMRAGQFGASASAENIYMGSSNGRAANNAWANSSGHRANMLGGFSRVGVGRAGGFFTQMFGF